ncbi:MAG: ABC transporter permease [Steroidobacteraceae bacterium]
MMLGYYIELAIRSLKRNIAFTVLVVAAVGIGIGTCMTEFSFMYALLGNPVPDKALRLVVPQIDAWGPASRGIGHGRGVVELPDQLSYRDAMALIKAHKAKLQTAMYGIGPNVTPSRGRTFHASGRATYADFFRMFEAPFRSGGTWSQADDAQHANVVVLSDRLADRLFPHADGVGKAVTLDGRDYRVVGVLAPWQLVPRLYDMSQSPLMEAEDLYLPFSTAIDRQMRQYGHNSCDASPPPGWLGHLNSECVWIQFWAELPSAGAIGDYRQYLLNYAADQRTVGRFHWAPLAQVHTAPEWIELKKVVPDAVKLSTIIAFGFLVVCLINAVGLMLARFSSRAGELGVRRALGASRWNIFCQCMTETVVVGVLGGVLGIALTAIGQAAQRGSDPVSRLLYSLNTQMVLITVGVAIVATVCSGLYPTLRASRVQPGLQLKTD